MTMNLVIYSALPTAPSTSLYYETSPPFVFAPPGVPDFSNADSALVTQCARRARGKVEKVRRQPQHGEQGTNDEPFLSRLPLYQNRIENPYKQGAVYCRSGGWLEILDGRTGILKRNGTKQYNWVRGTKRETSRFAILDFIAVAFGLISIRGLESRNFLCMDWKGALYATPPENYSADCVFMEEMLENYYNLYSSCAHGTAKNPWFISIRKSGKPRRGTHTERKQRSSHFVIVHFDESGLLDVVPSHLNQAAHKLQHNWMSHYGGTWRRSMAHASWTPAALLDMESKTLSQILSHSLKSRWKFTSGRRTKHAPANRSSILTATNDDDHSMGRELTEAERLLFRDERRRRRRLSREERRRAERRAQLRALRQKATGPYHA